MPSDSNRETRMPPLRQILAVLALGASLASQTAVAWNARTRAKWCSPG